MDDQGQPLPSPETSNSTTPSLAAALRRVRAEAAEQADIDDRLRSAERARLDMLLEALQPVLAQIPENIDLFDAAIMPGPAPRLFVDVIAFVEMAHDKRAYRFIQDTRHGRILVRESEDLHEIVTVATDYIARRIVERERALASDMTLEDAARRLALDPETAAADDAQPVAEPAADPPQAAPAPPRPARGWQARLETCALFVIDFFGAAVFFLLLAAFGWWIWTSLGAPPLPPANGVG